MVSKAPNPPRIIQIKVQNIRVFLIFLSQVVYFLSSFLNWIAVKKIKCSMIYITYITWSKLHLATFFLTIQTELKPNHHMYNSESKRTCQTYIISYGPIPELFDFDTT